MFLKGLREIEEFNTKLREKTVGALEKEFIAQAKAQQSGGRAGTSGRMAGNRHVGADHFVASCACMSAMRPLLESRVQALSLSLPGGVSEKTLRKAVIGLMIPLLVLEIVPPYMLGVAKVVFPPLHVLDPLGNNGLSLFSGSS